MSDMPMKQCKSKDACAHPEAKDGWLPSSEAYFRIDRRDNQLFARCRACINKAQRESRSRDPEDTRRRNNLANRKWRTEHADEVRHRNKLASRQRRAENLKPDKVHQSAKIHATHTAKWRKNNPEKVKAAARRRQERLQRLPNTLSDHDWVNALQFFDHKCVVCGVPHADNNPLVKDHWIPLANKDCPGTIPQNIVPLCSKCNLRKSSRSPYEWLSQFFEKGEAEHIANRVSNYIDWILIKSEVLVAALP